MLPSRMSSVLDQNRLRLSYTWARRVFYIVGERASTVLLDPSVKRKGREISVHDRCDEAPHLRGQSLVDRKLSSSGTSGPE